MVTHSKAVRLRRVEELGEVGVLCAQRAKGLHRQLVEQRVLDGRGVRARDAVAEERGVAEAVALAVPGHQRPLRPRHLDGALAHDVQVRVGLAKRQDRLLTTDIAHVERPDSPL